MFDICTDIHFDSHVCAVAYSGHSCFGVTSQNPSATTIANVDRFYSNFLICLQLLYADLILCYKLFMGLCCYCMIDFYHATLCISAVFAVSLCPSVCLSVRLSVTFVYCIQTAEDIVKLLSGPRSPIILVFFDPKRRYRIPRETPTLSDL